MSSIFHSFRYLVLLTLLGMLFALSGCSKKNDKTDVLATLAPIHSLLYGVMKDVQEPQLLLDEMETPHNIQLKPSDTQLLKETDLLIVTGLKAESYLAPVLRAMGSGRPNVVEALNIPGLTLWPVKDNEGSESKKSTPEPDMHIWLDPMNAVAITQYFVQVLSDQMPQHAQQLRNNGKEQIKKLHDLHKELKHLFDEYGAPRRAAYIAYHPSLQYFEKRYEIRAGRFITQAHHHGGIRVSEAEALRERAKTGGVKCLFKEPQFSSRIVESLSSEFDIPIKTLDPLGGGLPHDETLYFTLMRNIASTVVECLDYVPPTEKKKTTAKPDNE